MEFEEPPSDGGGMEDVGVGDGVVLDGEAMSDVGDMYDMENGLEGVFEALAGVEVEDVGAAGFDEPEPGIGQAGANQ